MITTIHRTFEEIPSQDYGNKPCCKCGKNISRTFTVYQTINPWNRKTPDQIRSENREKLNRIIPEWESKQEQCAACVKSETPDVVVDIISKEEWEDTYELRKEIRELMALAQQKEKQLNEMFKGRAVEVEHKGKRRIGIVTHISIIQNNESVSYDIVRSDLKGFIDDRDYSYADRIFGA